MGTKPKRAEHKKLRGAAMLCHHAWSDIAEALCLTPRELQIVQGVCDNLTGKQVASWFRYGDRLACEEGAAVVWSTQRAGIRDQRPNGLGGLEPLHLRQASGFAGDR
ncbi:MAG TPA: hypothetical protein PKI20_13240 [Verrucomicrobiota bacterium]|jgi:hypothetical protein|nr:hypothetical protein [Verrucomicrobiota bacterium]